MSKNLVIVESPAKAKTIEGYLGKGYTVKSCFGHVRDLAKGDKAIDIENGFKPTYEISKDKKEVVATLKKLAKQAEVVWLATDDDREGEAISWHLKEALDLNDSKTRRIVFREITKQAITGAIENPRGIDVDLVNAQQARRLLDRLVGFELSPILWKKIKTGLSAGRVQSVAVRIAVDREREIEQFNAEGFYRTVGFFESEGKAFSADLNERFKTEQEANALLNKCINADFTVGKVETKPSKKSPAPPFTTSTLQQEASRKLGYSVSRTMVVAQKLYEAGKITYMRTDSVNLSDQALGFAKSTIINSFGEKYSTPRKYKTKSGSAQEAHEAIRPTDFSLASAGNDNDGNRLYDLIRKRALASQMAPAELEKTTAEINISTDSHKFTAKGEVIRFEGFLKLYNVSTDDEHSEDDNNAVLPPLNTGQSVISKEIKSTQRFSRPPARYTEASLVKQLEELGIGRPSTYAPTISTIQKRGYIVKESREGQERQYTELTLTNGQVSQSVKTEITGAEKSKLFPTDTAMIVNDFLVKHFPKITNYNFTADKEKELDEIAEGKKEWQGMLDVFYKDFHPRVEKTESIDRSEAGTSRELGIDPASGKKVIAKLGKYGPYAQIGEMDDEEKPKFAGLRKGQLIETVTMEEAMELFKLPREIGLLEELPMTAAIGRFGPYIKHDNKFYSLGKEYDPLTVSDEAAIEIILAKRKADAEKMIKVFPKNTDIQILNGRWGPYIKAGKKNVKIPKGKDPKELTLEECLELAEKTPEKKGRKKK